MSAERFFDDLARTLAQPMPRRRALRITVGAVVGLAVPGVAARAALSAPKFDPPCKGTFPCECASTIPGLFAKTACPKDCPYHVYECVCPGGPMPKAVCDPKETCPEERRHCGPCCAPDQTCNTLVGKCVCKRGEKCASKCCPPGERCCPSTRMMAKSRCYDPTLECCTPVAGVLPKFPIKVAEWCPDRVKKKNFRPKSNGCGPEGGPKVPDAPAGADFKHACDVHDICYATCRQNKRECDRVFHQQMRGECRLEFGIGLLRLRCYEAAALYHTGVSKGGADAYDTAQKQGCNRCCP